MSFISYAQNFEDVMLWRALGHVGSGFYIDIGAWSPIEDSVTLAFYERGWHGINVEPNPEFHSQLQRDRPRDINLAVAVADAPGTATMHFLDSPGLSTLVASIAAGHAASGIQARSEPVEVTTLREIGRRHLAEGQPVHFLKVDVEGAEAAVLRGNDWAAMRPWVVLVEATLPMSQERCYQAWEPELLAAGYRFAYDDGINRFYVAVEHAELLTALDHPPNYFDRFVPLAQVRAGRQAEQERLRAEQAEERAWRADERAWRLEQQAARAEERAWRAGQQSAMAEARASQGEYRLTELNSRLQAVYASYSWRITAPLRRVAHLLLQLRPHSLKPLLRSAGERAGALVRTAEEAAGEPGAGGPTAEPDAGYSPRVLRLCATLRRLVGEASAREEAAPLRLAYVSPLPPECSGIADYSAELVPALAAHFRIDVIVEQGHIGAPDVLACCGVRDPSWLRSQAGEYDVVLYHMGNSHFHTWMFDLLHEVPGVVVLHDFFLGGLIRSISDQSGRADLKFRELYFGHGHAALAKCLKTGDSANSLFHYPCNRSVLDFAEGVIVHSDEAIRMGRNWYGPATGADWVRIPHARVRAQNVDRQSARRRLGLPDSAFVVCSFGMLGITKLNHRLLTAWLNSSLAREPDALLVFVGDAGTGDYASDLRARIDESGLGDRIRITGWADATTFRNYLESADLAVQLRSHSRGETSGTVLDCMNHGLPTIVNAHGSMAELAEEAVYRLRDEFDDVELIEAMEALWRDIGARSTLGARARAVVESECAPAHCAVLYHRAIMQFVARRKQADSGLRPTLERLGRSPLTDEALLALAGEIAQETPDPLHQPQLLVDVTETHRNGRRTGIERVARSLALALLESPPAGFRVEPVYLTQAGKGRWHYRYARAFTAELLGVRAPFADQGIEFGAGDRLVCLDIAGDSFVQASREGLFERMRERGVHRRMFVHDLLPVLEPDYFPPGADSRFREWLDCVARLDGALCFTQAVATALRSWMQANHPQSAGAYLIDCIPAGADIASPTPGNELPHDAEVLLARLAAEPSVLMVGTLEPRKGYLQALRAFTFLWERGSSITLVIVGRPGWQDLPVGQQRDIPELLRALRTHPECGSRLIWLDGIGDEYLERVYAAASGLLAASKDEGFGLPLIEAAARGLPVLARDIPVFREVAGDQASYFAGDAPDELAQALAGWAARGFTPRPAKGVRHNAWKESALVLIKVLYAQDERACVDSHGATNWAN